MFEKKTRNGVPFFTSTILPIPHAFSTRLGGVSSLPHLQSMNLGENRGDEPQNVQKNFDRGCRSIPKSSCMPKILLKKSPPATVSIQTGRVFPFA